MTEWFQRNGMGNDPKSSPTTQPEVFTARAIPELVPVANGIANVPVPFVQMKGLPGDPLEPTT